MGYTSKASRRSDKSSSGTEIGVCIFCENTVFRREYFNFAIDRPIRIDLPVHKACYKLHREQGDLRTFLQSNLWDYFYKYIDEEDNYGKKKKQIKNTKTRDSTN